MEQIGTVDPGAVIWRYLHFDKFASLILRKALWFSKLEIFEDNEEGITPSVTRAELKRQHCEMENWFPDEERRQQVQKFVEDNEDSGRELIVASCWFMADDESSNMWEDYGGTEDSVVVKSSVGALARSLVMSHKRFWIGAVKYIDPESYEGMNAYEGSQAHLRAFIKNAKYSHEKELRVATMNWVAPGCLNPDGSPPTEKQRSGYMYSLGRRGIFVETNLSTLIAEVRTNPFESDSHRAKVELLLGEGGCEVAVNSSRLRRP